MATAERPDSEHGATARRSAPLTREEILATALSIVDAEGTDALSMRRLARELGVEAMSLYHHVPNKQAVLDGIVELALSAQASPPHPSASWKDTVVNAVLAFRRALVAHPNVLPVMVAHPPDSPHATAVYIEAPLRYLVANGMADGDAADLFSATFAMAFGHALLSTNYPDIAPAGAPVVRFTEDSFERSVRTLIDGYAPDPQE